MEFLVVDVQNGFRTASADGTTLRRAGADPGRVILDEAVHRAHPPTDPRPRTWSCNRQLVLTLGEMPGTRSN
jgi:hypothetical protein